MSFWKSFGFHSASPIDTLLENAETVLEQLLDEPDFIQECKSQNRKLIDLFVQLTRWPAAPPAGAPKQNHAQIKT